jgi:acyl-CoA thioesterase
MTDAIAEASARSMLAQDATARSLGIALVRIGPGLAEMAMDVTPAMGNAHGMAHGGMIFALGDTAFGYAANSHGDRAVAFHCSVTFLAPAQVGDRLTATATEVAREGRAGIYDVRIVDGAGRVVAEFRGHSRLIPGSNLPQG